MIKLARIKEQKAQENIKNERELLIEMLKSRLDSSDSIIRETDSDSIASDTDSIFCLNDESVEFCETTKYPISVYINDKD